MKALDFTLKWEVGVDKKGNLKPNGGLNYLDEGLPTKYGIYKKANPDVDVENLTLEEAMDIYHDKYFLVYLNLVVPLDLDSFDIPSAVAIFDTGVNVGPARANSWWLKSKEAKDPLKAFLGFREKHYFDLVSANRPKYGKSFNGWMNRLNDLKKYVDVLRTAPD